MDFRNQVMLIVGASSGMGRTLALRLAAEGAQVVAVARRKERLDALAAEITQRGGRCLTIAADTQDPAAAERLVQETVQQLGRIDLVLLNAGGAPALDMRTMGAREVLACMRANYDVAVNVLFPFSMRWLVRLALLLPKRWTTHILRRELPKLPAHAHTPPTP